MFLLVSIIREWHLHRSEGTMRGDKNGSVAKITPNNSKSKKNNKPPNGMESVQIEMGRNETV